MQLAELMSLRQTVGAGVLVTLTERCPLACAHCSASATRGGRELDAADLLRFLRTFTPQCRPEVLMLTGGEPLTRPGVVVAAAQAARAAGTRTALLSGGFFAGGRQLPPTIRRAARAVDHFSLSVDAWHEREVPRADVLDALELLLGLGVDTSLHVLSKGPGDSYADEVAAEVTARFGTRVPLLVGEVRPIGRGATLRPAPTTKPLTDPAAVAPCEMAAWPVIAADGTVAACCNQDVVDGRSRPDHLRLGDIATDSWPAIRDRTSGDPLLRMIRTVGPAYLAARAQSSASGYCTACHDLSALPEANRWARRVGGGACGALLEDTAIRTLRSGGPQALVARHGSSRHAGLVAPGEAPETSAELKHP